MSLTDRSQIFDAWKVRAGVQSFSSMMSTSKRKGISLSKSIKEHTGDRSRSFIKLSARTKNHNTIQKREIKLIIKPKPEVQEKHVLCKIDKQNDKNNHNNNIKRPLFFNEDCGYQQIIKKNKGTFEMKQAKAPNVNSLRTKQNTLSKREGIHHKQNNKILYLRL